MTACAERWRQKITGAYFSVEFGRRLSSCGSDIMANRFFKD
jgi:hypothetical protein